MKNTALALVAMMLWGTIGSAQTLNTLSGVQFANSSTLFSSGYLGTVLQSTDAGQSWSVQSTGTFQDLLGISMVNTTSGVAVGGSSIYFSNGTGFLLRTQDGGNTWSYLASPNSRVLRAVKMVDSNVGYVVGGNNGSIQDGNGTIAKTTDGGQSWQLLASGTTQALYGVDFFDQNNGVAVGGLGTILRTENGGQTWTVQSSGSGILYGVSYASASAVTVVGRSGVILKSNDGGRTWASQSSGSAYDLYAVDFADANIGAAVGYSGTILRTTNGGSSWSSIGGQSASFNSVQFRDALVGTVVGGGGTILITANGGATWSAPSGGGGGGGTPPSTPTLASPANGATNQATTLTLSWNASTDAASYRLQVSTNANFSSTVYDNGSIAATSQSVGPLGSNATYYWRVSASNSAGTSAYSTIWSFSTLASGVAMFSVSPASIDFGTVPTGSSGRDSVTVTNAGSAQLNITSVVSSNAKFTVSPSSGTVAAGATKKFYITFSPGNKNQLTAQITFTHNAAGSPSVVAVTGKGGPKAASTRGRSALDLVELEQNYPNPFNPSTSIEYYIPEASDVTLSVFNILGQQVATLAQGIAPEGIQHVTWNARSGDGSVLPSGIYVYRLQTTLLSNGETTTRFGRMQLVK